MDTGENTSPPRLDENKIAFSEAKRLQAQARDVKDNVKLAKEKDSQNQLSKLTALKTKHCSDSVKFIGKYGQSWKAYLDLHEKDSLPDEHQGASELNVQNVK